MSGSVYGYVGLIELLVIAALFATGWLHFK